MSSAKVLPLHGRARASTDVSDEELLAACSVGDSDALGLLYDRHHPHVFRFVARLTRASDADVDDIVQDVFVAATQSSKRFEGRSSVRTWLFGVAANVVGHATRTRARHRALAHAASTLAPVACRDPEEDAGSHEFIAAVGAAIAALSHPLRVAFVLCDLEEVSCAEAARALDVPEGTVWRRRHEARITLREALRGRR